MIIRNDYASLYECFEFGQKSWCTYVKEIDMTNIWNKQYNSFGNYGYQL